MPNFRPFIVAAALIAAAPAVSALVPQDADNGQLINAPNVQDWSVYGDGQTHRLKADKAVQGGGAMIVTIPARPAHAWDIGASTPIPMIRNGMQISHTSGQMSNTSNARGQHRTKRMIQSSTPMRLP